MSYNPSCQKSLGELEAALTKQLFLGGSNPSGNDVVVWERFNGKCPSGRDFPYVCNWYLLVSFFRHQFDTLRPTATVEATAQPSTTSTTTEEKPSEKKEEGGDDWMNALEKDDDESPEQFKKRQERMKKAMEAKKKKDAQKAAQGKKKDTVIAKSLIMLDIKVWEQDQDLDSLASKIKAIEMDGLLWKQEYKTPVIAFGMKKLVMGLVVEDDKVSVDDVVDRISQFEDEVQSVDIASFNKI